MDERVLDRRRFSAGMSAGIASVGLVASTPALPDEPAAGITRNHAAIHQEIEFAAGADRLYRALTAGEEFDRVVRASAAARSMMKARARAVPARIDARPGGAFVLFGGLITGFNLELVPVKRLVQAWRSAAWQAGIYSVAEFELVSNGPGTTVIFDHSGFPDDAAGDLAKGWHDNYWEPLTKVLG